ncbi:hypothetical protein DL93DRAFT_764943 [Clavulina sp. PMI_390]|nr:hypothetical protein DL93DRAFT_764943 [Clavulina sp. PMI_390]
MISSEQEARDRTLEVLTPLTRLYGFGTPFGPSATQICSSIGYFFDDQWEQFQSKKDKLKEFQVLIAASFGQVFDLFLEVSPFACKQSQSNFNPSDDLPISSTLLLLFSEMCHLASVAKSKELGLPSTILSPYQIYYLREITAIL